MLHLTTKIHSQHLIKTFWIPTESCRDCEQRNIHQTRRLKALKRIKDFLFHPPSSLTFRELGCHVFFKPPDDAVESLLPLFLLLLKVCSYLAPTNSGLSNRLSDSLQRMWRVFIKMFTCLDILKYMISSKSH